MELEIHEYQASILRELLFRPHARFRDIKKVNVENDHFSYHVNRLVDQGLVIKESGTYVLSQKGKEFANRLDTESLELEKQAKVAVALHPIRERNGGTEYLVHQRLKEPFYGWYGSHSGKIKWGEKPLETARRELFEETGLKGKFILKGIINMKHYHEDGRFLEDKYFWVYKVVNLSGTLLKEVEEGRNIWMSEKEYRSKENVFVTFDEMIETLDSDELVYLVREKTVSSY